MTLQTAAFHAAWGMACLEIADHELDCTAGCPRRPCPTVAGLRESERRAWQRYDRCRTEEGRAA